MSITLDLESDWSIAAQWVQTSGIINDTKMEIIIRSLQISASLKNFHEKCVHICEDAIEMQDESTADVNLLDRKGEN